MSNVSCHQQFLARERAPTCAGAQQQQHTATEKHADLSRTAKPQRSRAGLMVKCCSHMSRSRANRPNEWNTWRCSSRISGATLSVMYRSTDGHTTQATATTPTNTSTTTAAGTNQPHVGAAARLHTTCTHIHTQTLQPGCGKSVNGCRVCVKGIKNALHNGPPVLQQRLGILHHGGFQRVHGNVLVTGKASPARNATFEKKEKKR